MIRSLSCLFEPAHISSLANIPKRDIWKWSICADKISRAVSTNCAAYAAIIQVALGFGRMFCIPPEISLSRKVDSDHENAIYEWYLKRRAAGKSVSGRRIIQELYKLYPQYKVQFIGYCVVFHITQVARLTCGYIRGFLSRHNLKYRAGTTGAQELPKDFVIRCQKFIYLIRMCYLSPRCRNMPPRDAMKMVWNWDETAVCVDIQSHDTPRFYIATQQIGR